MRICNSFAALVSLAANRDRIRPIRAKLGKDRSVFLFSTLDGGPAYGDGNDQLRWSLHKGDRQRAQRCIEYCKPPPAAPITLDTIYDAANQDLDRRRLSNISMLAYDKNWGAPFLLLPFQETFNLEKDLFFPR